MKLRKFPWLVVIGILLVIADQLSKFFVRQLLPLNTIIPVARGFLYLTFIENTGAAFGSLNNTNSILIWATLIAVGLILYLWGQFPKGRLSRVCLMFILAGSLGNLIDRTFLGYVTDFADFRIWPVFNLADSMVTIGIIGLMAILIREGLVSQKGKHDKKRKGKRDK
jgi:signal peptidase II